jgi:hypothetical protein
MAKLVPLSGMSLAIGLVATILVLAIAGPYLPGAINAVLILFQRKAELSGEIFVTMKSGDVKRGADVEVGIVRADRQFLDAWTALLQESTQILRTSTGTLDAAERLLPTRTRARQLVGVNLVTTVRTNAEGRYRFEGVPPGTYLVIAQYQVFDNQVKWSVLVTLKSGENTFNFTNSNAGGVLP